MFLQLSGHSPAIHGVRDYFGNISIAARHLLNAISGHKPRTAQVVPAQVEEKRTQRATVKKVPRVSDELRLYRLAYGADSVTPEIAAALNVIAARNRLS